MHKGFTLLELIVVIVILGILATLGFSQYTKMVEKTRLAEVITTFHSMRDRVIAYYLENGSVSNMQNANFGLGSDSASIPTSCVSTHFYYYTAYPAGDAPGAAFFQAHRCTSGGKTPNYSGTQYHPYAYFYPSNGGYSTGCQEVPGSGNSTPWCTPFIQ